MNLKLRKLEHRMARHKQMKRCMLLLLTLLPACSVAGMRFNPAFLSGDTEAVADLSRFEKGMTYLPGSYEVEIWVNDSPLTSRKVTFKADEQNQLIPCFSLDELVTLGINKSALPEQAQAEGNNCLDLRIWFAEVQYTPELDAQRLKLTFPQAILKHEARGYIPPEEWDNGIPAILINYDFSGNSDRGDYASDSYYLNLRSGLNLGAWRFRDYSTWSRSGNSPGKIAHVSSTLQRVIIPFKSELTLGDTWSSSDVFDSVSIRGAKLESDENMLPDSQSGFAPTVRGIAKSNAQVTIKQNGYVIYQTYTPPGPFEINDLNPTSSAGDLEVTIKESDNSETVYTIPYAAVPILQREGHIKYSATAGKYRSNSYNQNSPNVFQGDLIWGLPWDITAYGGMQYSNNYRAIALGLGFNLGMFGATSFDLTQANSTLADGSKHQGQSYRFLYSKSLVQTGTAFQIIGYRYSTEGFYSLSDTTYKQMSGTVIDPDTLNEKDYVYNWNDFYNLRYNKRGKFQANISQPLGEYGSMYLAASQQTYWNTNNKDTLYQVGYNTSVHGIYLNIAYNYSKSLGSDADRILSVNVSLPISNWLSPAVDGRTATNSMTATYGYSQDNSGHVNQYAGVSGSLLEQHNLNYNVQQNFANQNNGENGSVGINYRGTYGSLNSGYSYDNNGNQQFNYGLSGALVIHENGLTLSQPLGETNILIKAPGANNVNVERGTGVKTDWRGYAVVPYATEYRRNNISLDPMSMSMHTELDATTMEVIPSKGALVRAEFNTHVGIRGLFNVHYRNKPVPFGATVSVPTEGTTQITGIVGDSGQVYLSGLPLQGIINIQWGESSYQQCRANYQLPESELDNAISYANLECR
ncbi:fimbrial biogenesis usher protein [Escherichia coli]|nr:fimbrial biogenesis usher protein [Escherichia coli]